MNSVEDKLFLTWDQSFRQGSEVAGGKGWNLGRLDRYGFDVPTGGVLCASAYLAFIEHNGLEKDLGEACRAITAENIAEPDILKLLENLRQKTKMGIPPDAMRNAIARGLKDLGLLEKPVAVRSSATAEDSAKASFAGIHESLLNVKGIDSIMEAVKCCYASLWTDRAVAYRRKMNIADSEVLPAVVIMQMVEARAAGIAFSCDPRTGREDLSFINANYGLGESVVSGLAVPDQYVLYTRNTRPEIKEILRGTKKFVTVAMECGGTRLITEEDPQWDQFLKNTGQGQVLSNNEIIRLGITIMRVLDSLGESERHQDIEWAFDGNKFFLVQARPVTALPRYTYPEIKDQPEIWSNANVRDASPMVLSVSAQRECKIIMDIMMAGVYKYLGVQPIPGVQRFKCFNGRLYTNMSIFQWEAYKFYALTPSESNSHMGGHQQEIKIAGKYKLGKAALLKIKLSQLKILFLMKRLKKEVVSSSANIRSCAESWMEKNLSLLGDEDLFNSMVEISKTTLNYSPMLTLFNLFAGGSMRTLAGVLEKHFPGESISLINSIMAGAGNLTSANHAYRLAELAELAGGDKAARGIFDSVLYSPRDWESALPDNSSFKQSFKEYLKEFGHRAVYEMDIINPRWREDPSYLLNTIKGMLDKAGAESIKSKQKEKRMEAWERINKKIPFYLKKIVENLAAQLIENSEMREMTKSEMVRLAEVVRRLYLEAARRLAARGLLTEHGDIFHCSWYDIAPILTGGYDGRGLKSLVADRKERRKEMEALSPPDTMVDSLPLFSTPLTVGSGGVLEGLGVAAGSASGPAKVVLHPDEGGKLGYGEVLVAPSTDPAWTPLFLKAAAIVMETGGFLSHGSIVAREFGIPAVVNIPGVLGVLKDGQEITVDGDRGKVYLNLN